MPIGTGSTVDAGHLFIIMLIVVRIFISRCRISYPIVRCVIVKWPCSVSLLCALCGSNDLFMKYGNTPNASNPNSNSIIWHKTYIFVFLNRLLEACRLLNMDYDDARRLRGFLSKQSVEEGAENLLIHKIRSIEPKQALQVLNQRTDLSDAGSPSSVMELF